MPIVPFGSSDPSAENTIDPVGAMPPEGVSLIVTVNVIGSYTFAGFSLEAITSTLVCFTIWLSEGDVLVALVLSPE